MIPGGKSNLNIPFLKGLDQKSDPWQVAAGNFLSLQNTVFTKAGLLQKRNGFGALATLPAPASYLTTFADNLVAIGNMVSAYSAGNATWVAGAEITPLTLSTLPLIRNNLNQIQVDTAFAPNGLVCTAYTETNGAATFYKYAIADSTTGQNVIAPTALPAPVGHTVTGSPRTFISNTHFIIVYTTTTGSTHSLRYIAINSNVPSAVTISAILAPGYTPYAGLTWDGAIMGTTLYFSYYTTAGGDALKIAFLTHAQAVIGGAPSLPVTFPLTLSKPGVAAATVDVENQIFYSSIYDRDSGIIYLAAVDPNLNTILPLSPTIQGTAVVNVAMAAQGKKLWIFYEVPSTPFNFIARLVLHIDAQFLATFSASSGTITRISGDTPVAGFTFLGDITTPSNIAPGTTVTTVLGNTVGLSSPTVGGSAGGGDSMIEISPELASIGVAIRSVGLASKAFIVDQTVYFLSVHDSPYQPTYFVIDGTNSTSASPKIVGKLAYTNGGGYLTLGLPAVDVADTLARVPYLFKDLIQAVNKTTYKDGVVPVDTQVAGIYSQTGINLSSWLFGPQGLDTAEIGNDLHITGGYLYMYDGYLPTEHNFFLYPEGIGLTPGGGGLMSAQQYFYQVTYEWTDNQGNAFRSAPSIPQTITLSGSDTAVRLDIPTLCLTSKVSNPVKIVIYRWSQAQQSYYQVTSITQPFLSNTTEDSLSFFDFLSDAAILGNNLLYTTGGVIEDTNAPASSIITLFDTRLWLVDAEDPNLLWYSKQVIEATPVEMSDLLTMYIAPNTGTTISTGPITALAPMDDKLIIFKRDAIYYVNGTGPDNTGANNQYSQPIFITSSVGCSNQKSVVLMPNGLMFQSDKGIWLLGRDLSTQYIGAQVEDFNAGVIQSAVNVPETTQIRFTLSTGLTLMYDFFYQQWGTFVGIPCVSSCIYGGLHTFINAAGVTYQETPGLYVDGSNPVLIQFTSSWFNLSGLQGYQRAFFFYFLGQYISPHKLNISIAYDYNPSPSQVTLVTPINFSPAYGQPSPYGQGNPYGGPGSLERWRIFLQRQRCQAFQISMQEVYDPAFGVAPGAGLTLSGLNLVFAKKQGFRPTSSTKSAG